MSDNKIIETLNDNSITHLLLGANLLLLWIPIYTFIPNPKIAYFVVFYLLFILGGTSYKTIERFFAFPGSAGGPCLYFERTRFVLSLSSLTFILLWILKNLEVAYLFYSVLIIIVIMVYFFEIIMYPNAVRNKTHKSRKNNEQWKKQEESRKLKEKQRWNNLSLEAKCNEICKDIRKDIDSNYLNNAYSLLEEWKEEIIEFKGNNHYTTLINLYNTKAKEKRKENTKDYNWQCTQCGMHVKQHHEPSGKCNAYNVHRWERL